MKYTLAFLAALLLVPLATLHAAGPAEQAPPIGSAASTSPRPSGARRDGT